MLETAMNTLKTLRHILAAGVVALSVTGASAQDYVVPYNKAPETASEFWAASKYDMSLGNHARAAAMLGNYYDKVMAYGEEEQKKFFLTQYDTEGISPLLRLSTLADVKKVMRKDPVSGQDKAAVDILIARMTKFIDARLSDPERIKFFVGQLGKRPEERAYAITQLRASGARSIPAMLDVLRDPAQNAMHGPIFNAMLKMDSDIGPPLLAALDSKSDFVKGVIVDVFTQKADSRIVPDLYYLSASGSASPSLKAKAHDWLKRFLNKSDKDLGDAREKLVETAEQYHKQQVDLDGEKLNVWTWSDQSGLSSTPATKSQVEESRGIAYARKALDLDPRYRPAQIELLSIALDKIYEAGGPGVNVAKSNPDLQALLAGSPADLLEDVLSKALVDRKTNTALGAIKALAAHGDPSLIRYSERGIPALLQALRYHDRRVKFAAAEAALAINTKGEPFPGNSRVVDVLRHAATGFGSPKILVGLGNSADANAMAENLKALKYDVQTFGSGKLLLTEAIGNGNVGLIITDANLADPGFSYFLAQYKNHPNTAGMPLLVVADKDNGRMAKDVLARSSNTKVIAAAPASKELLDTEVKSLLADKTKPAFTDAERATQAKAAVDYLARMAKGELAGFDLNATESALIKALGSEALAASAGAALAYRSSHEAQQALANAVLNSNLSPATKAAVAPALRAHMQRYGNQLTADQVKTLQALATASGDAALREQADLTAASIKGDASAIGNRLKGFVPATTPPVTKVEPGKE
jgi:hypothetical protein